MRKTLAAVAGVLGAALATVSGVLAVALATLAAGLLPAAPAHAHAPRTAASGAHPHGALVGIGDQRSEMFGDPLWQQLHLRIARLIVPYDVAARPYSLARATAWIRAAEAQHQRIVIAFYHSEYRPMRLPDVSSYRRAVARFVARFPHVREYEAWNEANRGFVRGYFRSPSATSTARYYQALRRSCTTCTVIGLDVLDQNDPQPTLRYISQFKREVRRLHTVMPAIWGLHDYSDVNRREGWRTRKIDRALGGQVWLTETGGIVKFGRLFPNRRGSGLWRAARALRYTFALAASEPRIRRLYIYDWTGGSAGTRFDAGLLDVRGRPRPGYVAVCRHLLGTHADCTHRPARPSSG